MINEYALDPELIFEIAKDRRAYKDVITSFGIGTPRFVSAFPKKKSHKWESYLRTFTPSDLNDLAHTRADELINHLKENRIMRDGFAYDGGEWLQNVEVEDARLAFDVVFTNHASSLGNTLSLTQIEDLNSKWDHPYQLSTSRTLDAFCQAIASLLRPSEYIAIIDPYAFKRNGIASIIGFAKTALINRVAGSNLVIQVYFNGDKAESAHVYDEIKKDLSNEIKLHVAGIVEKEGEEKFHNRYVLSELGGIQFGMGIDIGESFHTDDLVLLNKDLYEKRWSQYVTEPCFNILNQKND